MLFIYLFYLNICWAATKTYLSTQPKTDVIYRYILFKYLLGSHQNLFVNSNSQQMLFIYLFYSNICLAATKTYLSIQPTTHVICLFILFKYLLGGHHKTYLSTQLTTDATASPAIAPQYIDQIQNMIHKRISLLEYSFLTAPLSLKSTYS